MAQIKTAHNSFNRGEVSKRALARVDLERMRLSAEIQENFMPSAVGPMMLRPGTKYVGSTRLDPSPPNTALPARLIPFVFSNSDTALLELTDGKLRVWRNDALITRSTVDTTVNNGHFANSSTPVLTGSVMSGSDMASGGGTAEAFDGDTNVAKASCATKSSAGFAYVGLTFPSAKRFASAIVHGSNDAGFVNNITPAVTIQVYGKLGAAPSNDTDGTVIGALTPFTDTANESAGRTVTSTDTITAWDHIWARISHNGANNNIYVAELKIFDTDWTLSATSGCTATISGGKLNLTATARGGVVSAVNQVAILPPNDEFEHAFRIIVERGPVTFKCGTTSGGDELVARTTLDTGEHSLTCTPGEGVTAIYLWFESTDTPLRIVDSITVESAGALELPTPWTTALLPQIRADQSGDIVFCACHGVQQRKIERRSTTSWSVVKYETFDGPFKKLPGGKFKMTPGAIFGNTTLTSERPFFTADHVGVLFRLFSSGQLRKAVLAAADSYTDSIRVVGVGRASRAFRYKITGTWTGGGARLSLQRSIESEDAGFAEMKSSGIVLTDGQTDGEDNVVCWYRIGFMPGNYIAGNATVTFHSAGTGTVSDTRPYEAGGDSGLCRVTGYTSPTQVEIEVLKPFSSLAATFDWLEGEWGDPTGSAFPSAVAFHDGRLWWAGGDRIWGSVSDDYYSFDLEKEGDSAPINRSVGFGPVDRINFMLPLSRLILGREGSELSVRSSSFDEPLTPTNFTLKDCSTQGSDRLPAVKVDTRGVFVAKSGSRVYELAYSGEVGDYAAHDVTRLNDTIGAEAFTDVAVRRQPDTEIYLPRGDGQCAVLLHDREDQVEAWWRIVSDGAAGVIENVAVLPDALEDSVYFVVKRIVGGATKRFIEKMARRDQCRGGPDARLSDAHVVYAGAPATVMTGATHLIGETVVAWGYNTGDPAGRDLGSFVVDGSGQIMLDEAVENCVFGLPYQGRFKSAKLAYGSQQGTALLSKKKIDRLGLILQDTHYQGVKFGQSLIESEMDSLPAVEDGQATAADTMWPEFDKPLISAPGSWDTDARLCLLAQSPRPCTVAAVVMQIQTNE